MNPRKITIPGGPTRRRVTLTHPAPGAATPILAQPAVAGNPAAQKPRAASRGVHVRPGGLPRQCSPFWRDCRPGLVRAVNVALERRVGAVNALTVIGPTGGNAEGHSGEITAADNWFLVSPYGEFENSVGLQVFDRTAANEMVTNFRAVSEQVGRFFRGLPIYLGHPDYAPMAARFPDKRRYGSIRELEARDDGLWAKPRWNKLGREAVNEEHYVFESPNWDMKPFTHRGRPAFMPVLLNSVGLTNEPNIPGLPVGANTQTTTTADADLDPMKREALITKLGLKPTAPATEVTDAEIDVALGNLQSAANEKAAVDQQLAAEKAAKKKADDDLKAATDRAANERTARIETVLTTAVNTARITAAERPAWQTRLETDFENASKALDGLTPAINTRVTAVTTELATRDKGTNGAGSRMDRIQTAVNERMASTKESYQDAWNAVEKDPKHKADFEAMHKPKHLTTAAN